MVNRAGCEPIKIVVVIKGGLVEEILSDAKGVDVLVKDLDAEGSCDFSTDPSGRPCNYVEPGVAVRPKRVATEFARHEAG